MNTRALTDATLRVISLLNDYSGQHVGKREMQLDPILYGYLEGRFGSFKRQHRLYLRGRTKPLRIDFRRGSTNPVLVEFAVRPPNGGNTLYGSQNRSELRKLSRIPQSQARLRILLLVDLSATPHAKSDLRATYESQTPAADGSNKHSVRVVYVHANTHYSFLWQP